MSVLKEYVTGMVAAALLGAVFNMLLPEGSIKKYASCFIGLAVIAVMLLPLQKLMGSEINFPAFEAETQADTQEVYVTMLEQEFCKQAEENIMQKSGGRVRAEVYATVSDKTEVDRVILYGEPDSGTMFYITNELGVSRNRVEIR